VRAGSDHTELQGATEARNDCHADLACRVALGVRWHWRGPVSAGWRSRGAIRKAQEEAVELTRRAFKASEGTNDLDVTRAVALLAATAGGNPPRSTPAVRKSMYAIAVLLGQQPGELVAELSAGGAGCPGGRRKFRSVCRPICCAAADVRQAERQLAAETAPHRSCGSGMVPKLSLTGDVGAWKASAPSKWFVPGSLFWSLGPSVQWRTLLDFGRVRAEVAGANRRAAGGVWRPTRKSR